MHLDEVGKRPGLHFFHDASTMNFDGALADPEFISNDFVRLASDNQVEDFPLAVRQAFEALSHLGMMLLRLAALFIG
ncbi:MAG: hypothetical protein WBM87_00130, partial [Woeseiaceae bacterium]